MSPRKLYNFYIDPDLAEALKLLKERTASPKPSRFAGRYASGWSERALSRKRPASARERASRPNLANLDTVERASRELAQCRARVSTLKSAIPTH